MWDTYNEDRASRFTIRRIVQLAIFVFIGVVIFFIAGKETVNFFMNIVEFGNVFTKPLFYSLISGLMLSSIALLRVDFRHRNSITWYGIRLIINLMRRNDYESSPSPSLSSRSSSKVLLLLRYPEFKMEKTNFIVWQVTKVVLFAPLFSNLIFGMATVYMFEGHDLGLSSLPNIFILPFVNIPSNGNFAENHVIPLLPTLTFIIPSLLSAVGIRVFLYIGVAGSISIASRYMVDISEIKPKFLSYISTVETIVGSALVWTAFTMFFSFNINYNTKYALLGSLIIGSAFIGYGFLDKRSARVIVSPQKKQIYIRLLTILTISVMAGSIMAIDNSIADAKKIEWMGPYVAQEIAVNRYIGELDKVQVVNYNVKPSLISSTSISALVNENNDTLNNIRLWDQQAAELKLRPELGQKNDVSYANVDILRFNDSMYWVAPTTPNLPTDVTPENTWYNEHLVYTHSDKGFPMLQANTGNIIDSSKYFKQKNIYYGQSGEDGIFDRDWSAFPLGRTNSDEIDQYFYKGSGGVNISPPLSWLFEPNFMLSYPDSSVHVMRFKDIYKRMQEIYPYFVYDFAFGTSSNDINIKKIDTIPVTDGQNSYWLMPLIMLLDTSHVPWSSGNMLRLVGFALIDAYNGSVKIIKSGHDPFSQIFFEQYSKDSGNIITEVPKWLSKQLRYPEEMLEWKINKFNQYHITNPETFIEAQQFYRVPDDVSASYIIAKPPDFNKPEFVGFQLLELSNSPARNLVGYMIVQNNVENFGKMTFYSIPLDSNTKLLDPIAAREALEKDPVYAKEKTLLRNPRVGDNILYRIGDQEVYFIPVYTSSTSGSVDNQLGTIAVVGGASVTGKVYIGLGSTPQQSFENYLLKVSGNLSSSTINTTTTAAAATTTTAIGSQATAYGNQTMVFDKSSRIEKLEKIFTDYGLKLVKPTTISTPLTFKESEANYLVDSNFSQIKSTISKFIREFSSARGLGGGGGGSNNINESGIQTQRIFEWQSDNSINFGILKLVNGILENHYVSIKVAE